MYTESFPIELNTEYNNCEVNTEFNIFDEIDLIPTVKMLYRILVHENMKTDDIYIDD